MDILLQWNYDDISDHHDEIPCARPTLLHTTCYETLSKAVQAACLRVIKKETRTITSVVPFWVSAS
jgi:hypothetical protein